MTLDDHAILVITIEAPREGDPICKLRHGYDSAFEGRIYTRRHGKTEEASAVEVSALEARLLGGRPTVDLSVVRTGADDAIQIFAPTEGLIARWVVSERDKLMKPLKPRFTPRRSLLDLSDLAVPQVSDQLTTDIRSRERFTEEVEQYISRASRRFETMLMCHLIERSAALVRLAVANGTPRNFERVQADTIPTPPTARDATPPGPQHDGRVAVRFVYGRFSPASQC